MGSTYFSANDKDDPIVIVGMACRVPKAKTIDQFWDNLVNGVDGISKVPEDRWDADAFIKDHTISTTQGGFVSDIDKFDNSFFQIGPREAEVMDPQQRQILEVTYECLESAGIPKEKLKGSRTGVFVGVFSNDYKMIQYTDQQEIKPYVATGGEYSIIANRISFCYDLKGPSLSIDTACSSSLVALHVAVQSIKSGEINSAIICGVNALLAPQQFASLNKMNMLSPDGRCKVFDSSANGYVRGEGFLALYIKPLSKALADGDPIRAIIRSTGVNQDGNKLGLTYPNKEAQQDLLRGIYINGLIQPQDVQYMEAHGTGTPGDPVEVGAIGQIVGITRDKTKVPLLIGSVKSNIGHLESASGLAGVIKTVIAMEKCMIPANLHFQSPNPKIDFSGMNLSVVSKLTPWPSCDLKRAGVNSFGFGGSNSHVLLEEPVLPLVSARRTTNREFFCFSLSAHTKQATEHLISSLKEYLERSEIDSDTFRNISYTLACRRSVFPFRTSIISNSKSDLISQLETSKVIKTGNTDSCKLLFVFTGQGAQYYAMGRELLRENPLFLQTMQQCDSIIKKWMSWSLIEELSRSETESNINRPEFSQPACAALQISLVKVWESYGVKPSAIVGHSSGEIAACYCAGILSLEDAMLAAIARACALRDTPATTPGKMAAVAITEEQARNLIAERYTNKVSIAAVNSTSNVTLSGDANEIDDIVASFKDQDVFAQVLRTERAYHSHHMKVVGIALKSCLQYQSPPRKSSIPMVSSVTGDLLDGTEVNGDYWEQNLTGTVKFVTALQKAVKEIHFHTVVEVGPHPALAGPIRQSLGSVLSVVPPILPTICRKEPETRRMLLTACALTNVGYNISLEAHYYQPKVVTNLPSFPWQHKSFWHESQESKRKKFPDHTHELLGSPMPHVKGGWINSLRLDVVSYLHDHCIQGAIVFPGAGYVAMMIAASGATEKVLLEEVKINSAIVLDKDAPTRTQIVFNSPSAVSVFSETGQNWTERCSGKFLKLTKQPSSNITDFIEIQERCTDYIAKNELYKIFHQAGMEYGPAFQGIDELYCGNLEGYAKISASDVAIQTKSYLLHPTLLDLGFQVLFGFVHKLSATYVATGVSKVSIFRPCHYPKYTIFAKCAEASSKTVIGDIHIFSPDGLLCAHVEGLMCGSISGEQKVAVNENSWINNTFNIEWQEDCTHCSWKYDSLSCYGKQTMATQLSHKVLASLSHKNCIANILEFGSVNNVTNYALSELQNCFNSYTVTYTPDSSEIIKAKYKNNNVTFRQLDDGLDILNQGFIEGGYDCIIVTDNESFDNLKNINKLLSPRGLLLLHEKMVDGKENEWRQALAAAGFTNSEFLNDTTPARLIITRKEKPDVKSSQKWYIIPDDQGFVDHLADHLEGATIVKSVTEIPARSHVIYLASLSPIIFSGISASVLTDMQQLASNSSQIIFVTSGSIMDVKTPTLSPIVGLVRSLRNEFPDLIAPLIDIDPSQSLQDNAKSVSNLCSDTSALAQENEIAIRNSRIYIPRMKRTPVQTGPKKVAHILGSSAVSLKIETRGLLDTLHWVEFNRKDSVEENMVELHCLAAGMNFKDVMLAMGLIAEEAMLAGYSKSNFGMEYAGIVTRTGVLKSRFKQGDRVVAFASDNFGTYACTRSDLVWKIPDSMTFEEAATIPMTFLTAKYGFDQAHLEKGESVLIHAAAGGVGLAAIQLCQLVGAEVFVTVGSEEKRNFIKDNFGIPDDHIMNSRTLDFAEQIKQNTNGKGVDVVLNSLSGDYLLKSFASLAIFGRFIEIGIRDIYANAKLDMLPFGKNKSFIAVDSGHLIGKKPQLVCKILQDLMDLFDAGKLKPLVFKSYPLNKVEEAFRSLQQGNNIGKVVLSSEKTENLDFVVHTKSLCLSNKGIYLLIGGMGGFGRAVATWLASKGVKNIAFISRSGSSAVGQQLLQELSANFPTLKVAVEAADITNLKQLESAVTKIKHTLDSNNIVGVMQMAMMLEDVKFINTTTENFNKVILPKTVGTQNIDRIMDHEKDLEFFIMFSSISSIVGNFGQSSYAAANSFMDSLALHRQAKGLPATCINWGVIGDVGYAYERKELFDSLARRGIHAIPVQDAMEALEYVMSNKLCQVVVAPISLHQTISTLPALASNLYSHLKSESSNKKTNNESSKPEFLATFAEADPNTHFELVQNTMKEKLGNLLGVDVESIGPDKKISEIGVDSLMAVEVKNWVESTYVVRVSVLDITSGKTISELASKVFTSMSESSTDKVSGSSTVVDPLSLIKSDVDSVTKQMDFSECVSFPKSTHTNILVTGATGFLGCHLLSTLLQRTTANFHCIVRARNADEGYARIKNAMEEQLCWNADFSNRIIPHIGDLSLPVLGMNLQSKEEFLQILASVDAVFHSGALVNWVLSYTQLRDSNVFGTSELLKLIASSKRKIPFHFISTVGVTNLEASVLPKDDFIMGGYITSKYAGEEISLVAQSLGLPVAIYRLPLLAPHSATGAANKEDILYRTMSSCLLVGAVPNMKSYVDSPSIACNVDGVVSSIVDFAFGDEIFQKKLLQFTPADSGASLFNILDILCKQRNLQNLEFHQWSSKIKSQKCSVAPLVDILDMLINSKTLLKVDMVKSLLGEECVQVMPLNVDKSYMHRILDFIKKQT